MTIVSIFTSSLSSEFFEKFRIPILLPMPVGSYPYSAGKMKKKSKRIAPENIPRSFLFIDIDHFPSFFIKSF